MIMVAGVRAIVKHVDWLLALLQNVNSATPLLLCPSHSSSGLHKNLLRVFFLWFLMQARGCTKKLVHAQSVDDMHYFSELILLL